MTSLLIAVSQCFSSFKPRQSFEPLDEYLAKLHFSSNKQKTQSFAKSDRCLHSSVAFPDVVSVICKGELRIYARKIKLAMFKISSIIFSNFIYPNDKYFYFIFDHFYLLNY